MSIQSARNQAESLIETFGIKNAPVDVEKLAKKLGVKVIYVDLDATISGLLITKPQPQASCIAIRQSDPPTRQRFSIAHEFGHYCLGHQFEAGEHVHVDRGHLISQRGRTSSAGTDLKEIEANQFAGSLLMPAALLRASVAKFDIERIYDTHVTKLAEEFNVSEQAMTIRLSALKIL